MYIKLNKQVDIKRRHKMTTKTTKTTKTIKVSHDLILSTEQAIDRYHLLAKKAEAMEDMGLKEYIEETKELVENLQTGKPVEKMELKYFIEDITNHWGFYVEGKQ